MRSSPSKMESMFATFLHLLDMSSASTWQARIHFPSFPANCMFSLDIPWQGSCVKIFTASTSDRVVHLHQTCFQLSDQLCKGVLSEVELLESLKNFLDLHLVTLKRMCTLSTLPKCKRYSKCEYHWYVKEASEKLGHGEKRPSALGVRCMGRRD